MGAHLITRRPAVADMFYPGDAETLRRQVRELIRRAPSKSVNGVVRGVVSPHAGYMYSGLTAAAAYATLEGRIFDSVVVISPSHREYFPGVSVYSGDAYRTPLGTVPVDTELREQLLHASGTIEASEAGHHEEHAIEVQLPFLQETIHSFKLLPLVMGDQSGDLCLELGRALAAIVNQGPVLLVASTDLSHYHGARVADALDGVMIEDVKTFDYQKLLMDLENGLTEACGGGPTVAVMAALAALGVKNMDVLHHCNSGDITGDRRNVVGYLSAVAWETV